MPLSFVVSQDDTLKMNDDNDVSIKCLKEALRKWQFTRHQVLNARKGGKSHWWRDMVCRGIGKMIVQSETHLRDEDIDFFWQSKA